MWSEKLVMWEELSYIVGLCQVPFCFMGDFNEILRLEEKKNAISLPASAEEFKEWVQDLPLVNLPLTDRKFKWFRGRSCSHIDRILDNVEWLEEFPDTRLKGEPRGLSDHCPLILENTRLSAGPRYFQSLHSLFTHKGFLWMVKDEWRNSGEAQFINKLKALTVPLTHERFLWMVKDEWRNLGEAQFTNKLKALTVLLRRWHKDNFGDMDNRIKKFEEEIKKIDDMVNAGNYDRTVEARQKALVTCCSKWYFRKELHLKQMSRSHHARDMDKNTKYFHNLASARRRNNRIDSLKFAPIIGICDGLVKQIDDEEAAVLEVMPLPEEIREVVWDSVLEFFQSAKLPMDANVTWVALVPKVMGAKEIKDLRPISMVGCVYKVISKVLVRRMRLVMPGLVGDTQSAFAKGRKIHDGALITCETVQWLKLHKKQAAIIKLDFQKAYDRVRWSFVDIVLQKMGFGLRWRTWVKECMTTVSMLMLINGSPSKPFRIERGLRQGDPLSPFLFILAVDILHRMVGKAVRNGRISPLLVGRDNIELSHLQFADDTILFFPKDTKILVNYKRLLRCFELMSGLSINFDKSSLILVNCEQELVTNMCGLLECAEATLPVKYLGISLGTNPRLVKTWKPIIDKVEDKLSLWKAKSLNKASKLVLIKSVLNSLTVLQKETLSEDITSYNFTSTIWRGSVPLRVELFAWFVLVGRVWCAWLKSANRAWAIRGTIKELFESWIEVPGHNSEQNKWMIGFFAVIWNIWLELNDRIFQRSERGVDGMNNKSFLSYKK
ncbi:uncharacterized protein [Arachis hypogaea]|uniref:uncharacterized protein n=1 Tax=Arachis hypogaea TaxID=3818 RepID=UPI003B20CF47